MLYTAAGTAGLLFVVSVYAQGKPEQSGQGSETSRSQLNSPLDQQDRNAEQQTVQGEITGFRHLHPRNGALQTSSFIRLRLQNGREVVVDVGQKSKLDGLNLTSGDQAQVRGDYREIAGQRVLVAHQLQVNGKTIEIEQPQEQENRVLVGQIEGFHNLDVQGSRGEEETHALVKLQLQNGSTKVLDLGPEERLSQVALEKGDRVRVRVEPGTLDNRPILLVDRVENLSRNQIGNEASGAENSSGKEITIRGHVRGYQIWTIEDNNQPMALLELQLQNGKSVFVGTDQYHPGELDLRNLELGDIVDIQAHKLNGKNGQQLIADSIQFKEPKAWKSQEQRKNQTDEQQNPGS